MGRGLCSGESRMSVQSWGGGNPLSQIRVSLGISTSGSEWEGDRILFMKDFIDSTVWSFALLYGVTRNACRP
jgi:hypothetical protein